jgi:hypothetical protein
MRSMIRSRAALPVTVSISATAEGLIRRLYLATLPKIFHDVFKSKVRLRDASGTSFEVFEILGKLHADRIIDEVGNGPLRFQGLEA